MIDFITRNGRWIAGGFLLTFLSSFGQTFFISASIGEWKTLFNLTDGEMGRLYMIATLASAITLPFLGKIVDIVPEHKVIALCAPLLALAMIGAAYANTILLLVVSIYGLRLFGQGMMSHISLTATGRWFAATRGRVMSLVVLGFQGGEAVFPLAFAAVTLAFGFKMGWVFSAVFLLFIGTPLAIWAYARPRAPRGQEEKELNPVRSWTRGQVLRDPVFYILLTGVLAPPFIGTTIFYHQDYMTLLQGWPPAAFASTMPLLALTTICFALFAGWLIDKIGAKRVLPFFLIPLCLACAVASQSTSMILLISFMFLLGVSYGFSSTLFGALWPEVYGTKHLGAVRSIIVAAMVLATAIGPGLTGSLIDYGISLPTQLAGLSVYCVFAVTMMSVASAILSRRLSA